MYKNWIKFNIQDVYLRKVYRKLVYYHRTCHDGRSSSCRGAWHEKLFWACCWCTLRLMTDHVSKENVSDRAIITAGVHHWISFQLKRSHFQLTYVACCSLLRDLCTTGCEDPCRHFLVLFAVWCFRVAVGSGSRALFVQSKRKTSQGYVCLSINVFVFVTQWFLTFLPWRNF